MRDEEARDALADPPYLTRVLADLPAPDQVWAEAHLVAGGEEARLMYVARRFEGLYQQVLGLLGAKTQ
jgi:hypothetical protein